MKTILSILMPAGLFFVAYFILITIILLWSVWVGGFIMNYLSFSQFESTLLALFCSFWGFQIIGNFLSSFIDLTAFLSDDEDEDE